MFFIKLASEIWSFLAFSKYILNFKNAFLSANLLPYFINLSFYYINLHYYVTFPKNEVFFIKSFAIYIQFHTKIRILFSF